MRKEIDFLLKEIKINQPGILKQIFYQKSDDFHVPRIRYLINYRNIDLDMSYIIGSNEDVLGGNLWKNVGDFRKDRETFESIKQQLEQIGVRFENDVEGSDRNKFKVDLNKIIFKPGESPQELLQK